MTGVCCRCAEVFCLPLARSVRTQQPLTIYRRILFRLFHSEMHTPVARSCHAEKTAQMENWEGGGAVKVWRSGGGGVCHRISHSPLKAAILLPGTKSHWPPLGLLLSRHRLPQFFSHSQLTTLQDAKQATSFSPCPRPPNHARANFWKEGIGVRKPLF